MTYRVEWDENNPLMVVIFGAIDPNVFVLSKRYTEEEMTAYRARRDSQTPMQNLKEVLQETFFSKWRATELYGWFEQYCPGYKVFATLGLENARVVFESTSHAMLFKLTWQDI